MLGDGGSSTPMHATVMEIPGGLGGVRETLRFMRNIARQSRKSLPVITAARAIVQGCQGKDYTCEARTLQAWIQQNIRYVRDPRDVEAVAQPERTLELCSGDCDDQALLLASLAESIGFAARFCAIGVQGDDFSHVLTELLIPGTGWVAAETIPIDSGGVFAPLGWFPPDATCFMWAHV